MAAKYGDRPDEGLAGLPRPVADGLADPLTAISLSVEACLRLICAESPDLVEIRAMLQLASRQTAKAQAAYDRLRWDMSRSQPVDAVLSD